MIKVKFAMYGTGTGVEVTCNATEAQEALNLYAELQLAIKEAGLGGFKPPAKPKATALGLALAADHPKR